jgi:HK97 gp10 family phage protein
MANVVTVEIKGLEDLEKKLYDLPTKFARRAMREAIAPAIELWRSEISTRAPRTGKYATGFMASEVATRITTSSREQAGTGMVGFTRKQNPARHEAHVPSAANEAFWYEMGTVHQPARPFIRPAFESKASAVLDVFTSKLRQLLNEVFK